MYRNNYNKAVIEYVNSKEWNKNQKRVFKNLTTLKTTIGNQKIGKDTIIFNMGTASQCPSDVMGHCELGKKYGNGKCYALKAERMYPQSLPFRKVQSFQWQYFTPQKIATDILNIALNNKKIKYIRLNESGDFWSQKCVEKLTSIANYIALLKPEIKIYTYTHRKDLDFSRVPENVTISGSNFMVHNNYKIVHSEEKIGKLACKSDCKICNLCKVRHGKDILQAIH
jgi:hypothetical protein